MASFYSGETLTAEQVAAYLYQAGFRGEALVQLTAIAKRESGYVTGAHRTDSSRSILSGDRGLFQINSLHDQGLMAAGIIRSKSDLFDPLTNAKAALWVYQRQGLPAWGVGAGGWQPGGDPFYGTNVEAARAAVNNAQSQGMLSADWSRTNDQQMSTGSHGTPSAPTAAGAAADAGPVDLPSDARLVSIDGGNPVALFNVGAGLWIYYSGSFNTGGRSVQRMTRAQADSTFGRLVRGGDSAELKNIPTVHGTYKNFFNSILDQIFPPGSPARTDPGVIRVAAEFAGRPDMSEAELQNKLKGTTWWKSKTEAELQWNNLSPAEQELRRQDMRSRMRQAWMEFGGVNRPVGALDRGTVERLASGAMTFSSYVETMLKPAAAGNPESPWSRQVRSEQEEQRQRPIDIENTANQIRSTLQRWGIRWSEGFISEWARGIVEKRRSDGDLLKTIQNQSKTLYPMKDPNIETVEWATPYLETYRRVMEEEGNLFTPEVGRALSQGVNIWDFEKGLKTSDKWLKTKNAREELTTLASEVGQRFGYA